MTKEQYELKKHQIDVLDGLMSDFKYGTNIDTARRSLASQVKEYESRNDGTNG